MTQELLFGLYIFVLAGFVGYQVISHVPPLLHTPLMAATNAISGISLVGSLVAAGGDYGTRQHRRSASIAVTCATINVVGGFLITDRMLRCSRSAEPSARSADERETLHPAARTSSRRSASSSACSGLARPRRARRGMLLGRARHAARGRRRRCCTTRSSPTSGSSLGLVVGSLDRRRDGALDPDDQDAGADRALARVRRPRGGAGRRRPSTCTARRALIDRFTHGARSASRCSSASLTFTGSLMAFGKLQG